MNAGAEIKRAIGGFADPVALVRKSANAIRPPAKISVSEAATRHRWIKNPGAYNGPWLNGKAPYLVEPMDAMLLRSVATWVLTGPSQFGKTEVFKNFILHAAMYRPGDVRVLQPGKEDAQEFVEVQVDERMIRCSRDLLAELGRDRGDDKAFRKAFRNGSAVQAIWPTAKNLSRWNALSVLVDERDRITDDVEGEGDPVTLCRNRVKYYRENGLVAVAGSPAGDQKSPTLVLFYEGDQRLWFVPCLGCGEFFAPGFDEKRRPIETEALVKGAAAMFPIRPGASADEAAAEARIHCPACHHPHAETDKPAMNARGVWLARGCTVDREGAIHGTPPATRTRSYWFCGLMSSFQSLQVVAAEYVAADFAFENVGDESKLKTWTNTVLGFPYRSKAAGEAPVTVDELDGRPKAHRLRQVPAGVRFLTAAIDVGAKKFDVSVKGWGPASESWLIDRFTIRQLGDGRTDVEPHKYPEHWRELLTKVFWARYELAEKPGHYLPIANVACDTNGFDGVWENAMAFYRLARAAGVPAWGITLVKGASRPDAPVERPPSYETDQTGERKKGAPPFYLVGVSRLKDIVQNRLRREIPGPRYVHLPEDLDPRHLAELVAETKEGGVWVRKGPNETWDLEVYNAFAAMRLKPNRVAWNVPSSWPSWAKPAPLPPRDDATTRLAAAIAAALAAFKRGELAGADDEAPDAELDPVEPETDTPGEDPGGAAEPAAAPLGDLSPSLPQPAPVSIPTAPKSAPVVRKRGRTGSFATRWK
jgi:phage terminase large subunit GpA-like protein